MPPEPVTREEMRAFIEASAKAVEVQNETVKQLTLVAERLKELVDLAKNTNGRLYNGMAKEIVSGVSEVCIGCMNENGKTITEVKKTSDDIKKDTSWILALIGLVTIATTIGVVVSQLIHWFSHLPKGTS